MKLLRFENGTHTHAHTQIKQTAKILLNVDLFKNR